MTQHTPSASNSHNGTTPTRRTIVQGAAWSIPVIAIAATAPLAAASQCDPNVTINWATDFTRTNNVSGAGSVTTPAGDIITFTVTSTIGTNLAIPTASNYGTSTSGLLISDRQTVAAANTNYDTRYQHRATITFDTPVQNLRFHVADVDGTTTNGFYREYVAVSGVTATATPGAQVVLSTTPNTYRPANDTNIAETNPAGWVQYAVSGSATSFNIDVTTPGTVASGTGVSHGVHLSNLGFEVPC